MGKCMDCGRKVSFLNPFSLPEECSKCGVTLCKKCIIYSDKGGLCRGCHFPEQKGGGIHCFIATACYGVDSEEVEIFKNWRDKTLMKSNFGKGFIKTYYKISPSIANFISNKPKLKRIVRLGLYPIKEFVK